MMAMMMMTTMMLCAIFLQRQSHCFPRERVVQSLPVEVEQFCILVMVLVHVTCNDIAWNCVYIKLRAHKAGGIGINPMNWTHVGFLVGQYITVL